LSFHPDAAKAADVWGAMGGLPPMRGAGLAPHLELTAGGTGTGLPTRFLTMPRKSWLSDACGQPLRCCGEPVKEQCVGSAHGCSLFLRRAL